MGVGREKEGGVVETEREGLSRQRGRGCRDREVAKVVLKRVVRRGRRRAKKTP
jgi:hypothetical protein